MRRARTDGRAGAGLWLALGFLTVLPTPYPGRMDLLDLRRSTRWYPLVGYVLGGLLALAWWALRGLPAGLSGALLLALWLGLTGMLHLDGLLDSADALLAPVGVSRRLAILKDVHAGSFALGTGVVFLILKWQALTALSSPWPLLAVPALARLALLPLLRFPTARPGGLGDSARGGPLLLALLIALPAVLAFPVVALAVLLTALLVALWARRRLGGGLTGDVYGASIELSELVGLLAVAALAAGCSRPQPPASKQLVFVRDGVITDVPAEGRALPGGRWLVARSWSPGELLSVGGVTDSAPLRAECVTLFSQDLGDVSRLVAAGGSAPSSALAFSPDGGRLAVGSYLGEVLVLDGWTGQVLARRRLAETMVKSVAWAADGHTLYAAEQSPDAALRALDPATLDDRWTLRLADIVGSSALPAEDDRYGVYSLPAAYGLEVLGGGDLLTSALHSWTDSGGEHRNLSQLLRISPQGDIVGRWPGQPVDGTIKYPVVNEDDGLVALSIGRSAAGPAPVGLPVGGVQVLDLATLAPVMAFTPDPLLPWFKQPFIWEALDVSRRGVFVGLGDGRWFVVGRDGQPALERSTGAPIMAGEVPINASVGFGRFDHGGVVLSTSTTLIPWGAAASDLRPPTAHPAANTVWSLDAQGELRWSWSGSQVISGVSFGPGHHRLVVGAGDRQTDTRRDLYGALVFDLDHPQDGRSGEDRLLASCATQGPVFFRQAMSADGRVAVAEYPYDAGDGVITGAYRVTVLR